MASMLKSIFFAAMVAFVMLATTQARPGGNRGGQRGPVSSEQEDSSQSRGAVGQGNPALGQGGRPGGRSGESGESDESDSHEGSDDRRRGAMACSLTDLVSASETTQDCSLFHNCDTDNAITLYSEDGSVAKYRVAFCIPDLVAIWANHTCVADAETTCVGPFSVGDVTFSFRGDPEVGLTLATFGKNEIEIPEATEAPETPVLEP